MEPLDLIATATFGLEAVVSRELAALGYSARTIQPGRLLFCAPRAAIARTNLWLRAADRVLVRLDAFEATDFGELFDRTYALPWHEWIPADGCFPVNGRSIKSQLSSVPACQKIVKKAIVEKLKAAHGVVTLDETGPRCSVEVALLNDEATLTLDTTGPGLHKRGYRELVGRAPLKETLAAAMVLLSFWRPERPLIDPFCGSGTIPIEAALVGRNIAPGLNREFAAEAWPSLPAAMWEEARREARDLIAPELSVTLLGTDIDDEALSLARHHAARAGVSHDVQFSHRDFRQLSSKRDYGCIITNPPYGRRVGQRDEVRAIYEAMPEVLRRLKTWSHYILTSHGDFEQIVGQEADRRRKLYNGRIQCTYFQFHGPRPPKPGTAESDAARATSTDRDRPSPTAVVEPAFGGLGEKAQEQGRLFRARLLKRAKHLRRYPTRQGITCYRIYERDIPEIPLVVDRYEDCLHITEYERPHERSPAEHADWLDLMTRTAARALDVDPKNCFLKRRERPSGPSQYERQADEEHTYIVHEGGLQFIVNLSDYVDTGLFLDHRLTRSMVRDAAAGKRFLNLFCYTGSFTVYAAAGGAVATTSVDLSNTYLDWARRNMRLGGFTGLEHRFVRGDATSFLAEDRDIYDLAVVDPPTFSNSKMTEGFWDVQRDHAELLVQLMQRMSPGGVVFFSTNFRSFKFDDTALARFSPREITRQTVPPEYRNRRIHRAWRLVHGD